MANLTSTQANKLSDDFFILSRAIADFRYEHWDRLTLDENKKLSETQGAILRFGEDILALSTTLVMNEVTESLAKISAITGEINGTIKTLTSIQKGLNAAAAILVLGAAIVKRDPMAIGDSIRDLFVTWKE